MTAIDMDTLPAQSPELPGAAPRTFLILSVVAFVAMTGALIFYGIFGERITSGLDQACAEAALDAGRKLEANGNSAQAIQKYRQALAGNISDDGERYRCGLAIGDILFRDRRYGEALAAYRELPPAAFDTAGAYAGYVGALWNAGEELEATRKAEAWLALAQEEANTEQEVWARTILKRAAESRNDTEAILEQCRGIVAVDPGHRVNLDLARLLDAQGDTAGARALLEALLSISQDAALKRAAQDQLTALGSESVAPS